MKQRKIALVLLLLAAFPLNALAAPGAARTVDLPIFDQAQVLDLPRNVASFWFSLPRGTVLGGEAQVRLHLRVSDTLIDQRSSITLSLNGEQLAAFHILDIVQGSEGWWEIPVDAGGIRTDGTLNELTFTTAQRSIEGDCADIDNPANWVKLEADSCLRLNVRAEGDITLAGAMSYMYDALENRNSLATEIVLNQPFAPGEISAMLSAMAAVGQRFPYRDDLDLAVSPGAEASAQANKLYVGDWTQAPPLTLGEGYLAVSRQQGINRLLVAGADELGLKRAASLLSRPALLQQAEGGALTVNEDLPPIGGGLARSESGYYTLADFGYESVNLAGAFHQQTRFTLTQPGGMVSGDRSYIEVRYRHSQALISDNSLLTVYVNDTPMASAKLSAANAAGGSLKVTIPREALAEETIAIRIDVYNYLGKLDCSKDYYDTAWTVIDKQSQVYFEPGTQPIIPSLKNFPSLDGELCVVVAPQEALAAAAAAALRAGQRGARAEFQYHAGEALMSPRVDADYIIFSDYESLNLPTELAQAFSILPLGAGQFSLKEETGLIASLVSDKVTVQVVRAPWAFDRRVYLITYPQDGERAALKLLSEKRQLEKLDGQAALVSPSGGLHTMELGTAAQHRAPLTWERLVYLTETRTGYPIQWVLALAAVLLVILIFILRAARNRSRFKKAEKGVRSQNQAPADQAPEDGPEDGPEDEERFRPGQT